jgi:hypothetical protein
MSYLIFCSFVGIYIFVLLILFIINNFFWGNGKTFNIRLFKKIVSSCKYTELYVEVTWYFYRAKLS